MRATTLSTYLLVLISAIFTGCGGNESGNSIPPNLMGGAVQGQSLSLTGNVKTLAGTADIWGSEDGIGSAARFNDPIGITTDGANLYIAELGNYIIRKINISTGAVTTIAGTAGVAGSEDGFATDASFNAPYGITTDGRNIYFTDFRNDTIRKLNLVTEVVTTIAGVAGVGGFTDGIGASARFNIPRGITTDGLSLYVADSMSSTIRKINISTGVVTTIAGNAQLWGSADGIGAEARFAGPDGITTDGANLYVTDVNNATIRKIVISTGEVSTIAGTAGSRGSVDGTGASARFDFPSSITTDGTNLYVGDSGSVIRKIDINTGVVTTIAGAVGITGSTDGIGSEARFNHPHGITSDGKALYVTEANTIRRIE